MKLASKHYGQSMIAVLIFLSVIPPIFATPLHEAVMEKDVLKLQELIANGVDVNECDTEFGVSPLKIAASIGDIEIVRKLIKAGAIINIKDNTGVTPLHSAAEKGHKEVINILIDNGADVNAKDKVHGVTPLHVAIFNGRNEVLELLILKGSDVNLATKAGETPLLLALNRGDSEVIKLLRKHGAVNTQKEDAILLGYYGGYLDLVASIMRDKQNTDSADYYTERSKVMKNKAQDIGINDNYFLASVKSGVKKAMDDYNNGKLVRNAILIEQEGLRLYIKYFNVGKTPNRDRTPHH